MPDVSHEEARAASGLVWEALAGLRDEVAITTRPGMVLVTVTDDTPFATAATLYKLAALLRSTGTLEEATEETVAGRLGRILVVGTVRQGVLV